MSKTKASGRITYDDYFGHVCTCTERVVVGHEAEGYEVAEFAEYEPTVHVARDLEPTDSGSWYYVCSRCGAGAWSGL